MSSVEWGTSAELETGSSGRNFLRTYGARLGRLSDVRARRIAAGGLLGTFGLVLAALWVPWFTLGGSTGEGEFSRVLGTGRNVGAMTALYQLAEPYFLGWSLIGILGTTAVLGRRRFRRTAAGLTAGAIAGQTLVVMAVWHDNGVGLFGSLTGVSPAVQGHRAAGMYLVLAALVLAALSMVIAVRGRLLALFHDDEDEIATVARRPQPHEDADDQSGVLPRLGSPSVEAVGSVDDEPVSGFANARPTGQVEKPDHSVYMRPQGMRARS